MNRIHSIRNYGKVRPLCGVKFLTDEGVPKATEFLQKHFVPSEPLMAFLEIHKSTNSIKEFTRYTSMSLNSKVSLVVTDEKKNIVGLCLNRILRCGDEAFKTEDPKFKKIINLFDMAQKENNMSKTYDINRYMHLDILCVKPEHQSEGIGRKLMELTKQVAKDNNLKIISVASTSHYASKLAYRLGFTPFYTIKFEDYKVNGEEVFKPKPPHDEFCVFTQRLDEFHGPLLGFF